MDKVYEHIVVGTGPTGAQAAHTLVEGGAEVLLLDVGYKPDDNLLKSIPEKDYLHNRQNDANQRKYFLGENFEAITWTSIQKTAQLTPPRQYLVDKVDKWLPTFSDTFQLVESLAYGGLSAGWGLGSQTYSDPELEKIGLDPDEMEAAYQVVGDRIGISAEHDDVKDLTMAKYSGAQPAVGMDKNMESLLNKYNKRKEKLNKRGIYMGRTPLALLTQDKDKRKGYNYRGMDFYDNGGLSAYRSWMTIDELQGKPNFHFESGKLVISYKEHSGYTEVFVIDVNTHKKSSYKCKKLVLACNVTGTARIVLRSAGGLDTKLPILSDPYVYIPGINLSQVGRSGSTEQAGFSQLVMYDVQNDIDLGSTMASIYGYRELLQFKLAKEFPLDFGTGRVLAQLLQPTFIVAGIHHEDYPTDRKFIELKKDKEQMFGDALHITYEIGEDQKKAMTAAEKRIAAGLKSLGVLTLGKVDPGYGASVHYVGTLPFSEDEKPLHTLPNGKLSGSKNVYIADGSGWNYLPSKSLTFTLMAGAHNVALNLLKNK